MIRSTATVLTVLLLCVSANGQESTIEAKAAQVKRITQGRIDSLTKTVNDLRGTLANLKKGVINKKAKSVVYPGAKKEGPITFPSKEVKASTIETVEKELVETEKRLEGYTGGKFHEYGDMTMPPKLGYFGSIESVRVQQVIDDKTMLAKLTYDGAGTKTIKGSGGTKLVTQNRDSTVVMIKGVSTKGMTDDTSHYIPKIMEAAA